MMQQQESLKQEMKTQIEEYEKLVTSTQNFRGKYAYKMQEIIQNLENSMRINVQNINQSIIDYSSTALQHNVEIAKNIDHLQLDIKKLQLQDQFEAHLLNLPQFDVSRSFKVITNVIGKQNNHFLK